MNDETALVEDNLIIVRQLPIIEQQLLAIKERFSEETEKALSLACTEDTLQSVKKKRAELSKLFAELEDRRKTAKKAVMAPYEEFEKTYKECVTDIFRPCDAKLAEKIHEVENGLKEKKKSEVVEYFNEYCVSKGIDFISFDSAGITITLAASKKGLREQAKAFVDRVCDDLALIDTQDFSDEILIEYKRSLNSAQAILTVTNRHKAIEEERRRREERSETEARKRAVEESVNAAIEQITPPTVSGTDQELITEEKIYEVSFTVRGTLDQIKALKRFLTEGEYVYDQQ